jgi:hypothetical protein
MELNSIQIIDKRNSFDSMTIALLVVVDVVLPDVDVDPIVLVVGGEGVETEVIFVASDDGEFEVIIVKAFEVVTKLSGVVSDVPCPTNP